MLPSGAEEPASGSDGVSRSAPAGVPARWIKTRSPSGLNRTLLHEIVNEVATMRRSRTQLATVKENASYALS